MRAIRFSQFGNPSEVLSLQDIPTPEPAAGQVRLRLSHRSINPSDLVTVAGEYGRLPTLPATPGYEGMGTIDALGAGVTGWALGQRVIPLGLSDGTWQEYALCDAARLIPVMDGVSDQTAAQFVVNPMTAWVMLTQELGLQPGDWVLQNAAGSTLGRVLLQIAQLKGYKTVNFVRRREQIDELLALGADAVICTEDQDAVQQVMKLTGKGAKGALDAVGGATGALTANCLAPGGTMLVYGVLSAAPIPLNSGELLFKGTTVRGFWLTYWFRRPPEQVSAVVMELMGLMAAGKLTPPVEAEYDLADFQRAIIHAETPGRSGKVLLVG